MDPETVEVLNSIRKMLAESGKSTSKTTSKSPYSAVEKELKTFESKKIKKKCKKKGRNLPSVKSRPVGSSEEVAMRTMSLPYIDSVMLVDESLKVSHHWSYSNTESNHEVGNVAKSEIKALVKRFPRFCEGLNISSYDSDHYKMRSDIWLIRIIEESYDAALAECIKPVSVARTRRRYDLELGALDCFPHSVKRYMGQKYSSIEDILPQVCIELLLCINRVSETMDKITAHRNIDGKSPSHGGRVFMFASFLSEEFDVDRLATYLHTRDVVQETAGVKFRDIAVHLVMPLNDDEQSEEERKKKEGASLLAGHPFLGNESSTLFSPTMSTLDSFRPPSTQNGSRPLIDMVDAIDAAKVCPVKLPYTLRTLQDCTMPETPLLAIDLRTLTIICQRLTPRSGSSMRRYLFQKCMMWTDALINMQTSMFKILLHLQDPAVFDECTFNGVEVNGQMVIPAHVVMWMVATEISYNSAAAEKSASQSEAPDKGAPIELSSTEQGIYMLNNLYDNNREKVHKANAEVDAVELELSHAKTKVLMIEKKKRRIERKWREYVPDHSLTGLLAAKAEETKGYDLEELAAVRTSLAEAEEEKFGIETKLKRTKKKRSQLMASIDATWESTIAGKAVPSLAASDKTRKKTKAVAATGSNTRWRDVVISKIMDAIVNNSLSYEHIRESRNAFDQVVAGIRTGDPEVDKAYMYPIEELKNHDVPDEFSTTVGTESAEGVYQDSTSLYELSGDEEEDNDNGNNKAVDLDASLDIASRIAALEGEARKLAAVGRVGDVNDMAPADILGSPVRIPGTTSLIDSSGDYDKMRTELASREAEDFVDGVIKKHGLDDDDYMRNIDSEINELRKQLASREVKNIVSHVLSSRPSTAPAEKTSVDISTDDIFSTHSADPNVDEDMENLLPSDNEPEIAEREEDDEALKVAKDIPDFDLFEFVSPQTEKEVEQRFSLIQNGTFLRSIGRWQHYVRVGRMLKVQHSFWAAKRCRFTLKQFSVNARMSLQLKNRNVVHIQCLARNFLAKKKVDRVRRAEEARNATLSNGLVYIEKIRMRYALKAFVFNRIKRQKLKRCSLDVKMKRVAPFFKKWQNLQRQVRLVYAVRGFLARRKAYKQRYKRVRLAELNDGFPVICKLRRLGNIFSHWRFLRSANIIFRLTYRAALLSKVSRRFSHWKNLTIEYANFRIATATRLVATVRMHMSKRKNMDFYTARKGMVSLQCVVRGRIAQAVVAEVRRRYHASIVIQRYTRGWLYRLNMQSNRIADIHNAASSDNYDRLLFYLERYYNLTFQLDEFGNSALHNAAQHASKRCVKLLLRYSHDQTLVNPNGYSPLHLLITSAAPYRDSMFEYMISVGFDEFQLTGDGKSALILAAEHGRSKIVSILLDREHNPNDVDSYSSSALQYACIYGFVPIVRSLLEYGADCNSPGYEGMSPLHDVTTSGSVEITNMLLESGAVVDVQEPGYGYTPLMLACRNGLDEIVDLMLLQDPDINIRDFAQCTVAHHVTLSDSLHIANALREADVDFTVTDFEGNCPLHYAAQYGAVNCMEEFLHSLAPPSIQNIQGNQPAHIAAQYNQVGCLKALLLYDEHIGRMNYKHMTPLGMAKFHMSREAQVFLEEHFRKIDGPGVRNAVGDVWWDKELDKHLSDWRVVVDESNHRHYVNDKTGEVTLNAPKMRVRKVEKVAKFAQVPMAMRVIVQDEESRLNHHDYDDEFKQVQSDIADDIRIFDCATMITKTARRKLVYMKLIKMREAKQQMDVLARFFARAVNTVIRWKILIKARKVTRVQSLFRGYSLRCHFYYWDGTYEYLWYELAKRRLARQIWTLWTNFKTKQMQRTFQVAASAPVLITDWEPILDQVGYPVRTVGVVEEYLYPNTHKIFFYRNFETGAISFDKPKELVKHDRKEFVAKTMQRELGYTPDELWLSTKIQALWRGHKVRMMYVFIVRATAICVSAETNYLSSPDSDRNLFNYTLYCHVVSNDYDRARPLYIENLRRMTYKGPDVAQILYAYAIYAFVTHEQDVSECFMLVERARAAEQSQYNYLRKQKHRAKILEQGGDEGAPYKDIPVTRGKCFELANVGFFRYMCNVKNNSDGFHNYAACRFLVYEDFESSFDAFMGAFKSDPMNDLLRANYEAMMEHFFAGNRNLRDETVNKRMQFLASKDNEEKDARRARIELAALKNHTATRIQKWYRHHRGLKDFYIFVARLRRKKQKALT